MADLHVREKKLARVAPLSGPSVTNHYSVTARQFDFRDDGQQVAQLLFQSTLEFTALFILLYSYIFTSSKLHVTCAKVL